MELLTLSEVVDVSGDVGNFTVTIKKKPRYIDMDKCIACGLCAQKCPRKVRDEFNLGLNDRTSAYIKYGQSVPLKYAIDGQTCIYLTRGKCKACEKFCPTSAINFEDKEEVATLNVGAVILAPGFKPFDPSGFDFYGYKRIPDVVTSLEYERLLSSSGPCMGHLVRPSDRTEPRRIAWIQCVGSRNTNQCKNGYCSSVCCMYAIKEALVTAEHTSGGGLEQAIFFMDIRSHGKDFDRFYEGAKDKGVRFVRARPHSIEAGAGNHGVSMRYIDRRGRGQGRGVRPGGAVGRARAHGRRPGTGAGLQVRSRRVRVRAHLGFRAGDDQPGRRVRGRRLPGPQGHPAFGRRGLDRGLRGGHDPDLRPRRAHAHPQLPGRAQFGRRTGAHRRLRVLLRHQHRRNRQRGRRS